MLISEQHSKTFHLPSGKKIIPDMADTGSNSKADSTADSTTPATATNSSETTVEPEAKRMKLSAE